MPLTHRGDGRAPAWWPYAAAAILSVVVVVAVLRLWETTLRLPLAYHAEVFYNGLLVKGVIEQGWHLDNPALGAPLGIDLRDVPMSDNNLHFALIRLLGLFTPNYALVMNLFYLSTFPLTALSALFVFRRLGISVWPALAGSLLYTFLPYHFGRGQHHLFLAAYYLVPLGILVTLWIMRGPVSPDGVERRWSWRHHRRTLTASAIICVLVASAGVYYAFFTCFFFLVAGGLAAFRARDLRPLVVAAGLVALTTAVVAAHFTPSLVHAYRHGDTPIARRNPVDAEQYGLRIAQLLLPATGHRLPAVARFRDVVNVERGSNESDVASLGLVGSVGFLVLLGRLLLRAPGPAADEGVRAADGGVARRVLGDVTLLNLAGLLLGTIGGFGSLVAWLVLSKIRGYNRISIFIAFFSLFAVVAGLDALCRRYGRSPARRAALAAGLAAVVVLGVLDQTSARAVGNYAAIEAEDRSDRDFVAALEATLPPGAMVFQLPAVPFPEHPPVHRMQDYDHARAYLHGSRLRWSYGAMRGREGEAWQRWVTNQPPREMLDTLAAAGFGGVYLNRDGYADRGARLGGEIAGALDQRPRSSRDERVLFFDLTPHRERMRAALTPEQWAARQDAALHPLLMIWQYGCSDPEGPADNSFRWCSETGTWLLVNRASRPKRVKLDLAFSAPHPGNLRIDSPFLSGDLWLSSVRHPVSDTWVVPPGQHAIHFTCAAPRLLASGDRRRLVFRVVNFRMSELLEPR